MKWTSVIQQKIKAALVLCTIMSLIVLFNFIERNNVAGMNDSVNSIYKDRLIPATDIFYISENFYEKRFLTEQFLQSANGSLPVLRSQLASHNQKINALLNKYAATYLVDEESKYFNELKDRVREYRSVEEKVLELSLLNRKPEAAELFQRSGKPALQNTVKQLAELTRIQTTVGGQLIKDSKGRVATASMISSLQMVLAIITGLIIIALIFASAISNRKEQNFHLN